MGLATMHSHLTGYPLSFTWKRQRQTGREGIFFFFFQNIPCTKLQSRLPVGSSNLTRITQGTSLFLRSLGEPAEALVPLL